MRTKNIAKLSPHCRIYGIGVVSLVIWTVASMPVVAQAIENLPIPQKRPGISVKSSTKTANADLSKRECVEELRKLGAIAKPIDSIKGQNGCGVARPVELFTVAGDIDMEPPAKLTCEKALAVAKWSSQVMKPAASSLFPDTRLTSITNASSYVCRTVNRQKGAKLSQHAFGLALDISGFDFADGSQIEVSPTHRRGSRQESFQRAVRYGSCAYFTKVLGPGSDAAHANHLHFDLAERRGGYRLCKTPKTGSKKED